MTETAAPIALRARFVFPIASPPLDGGVITLQGGRIVAVGHNASAKPAHDLGDVALLPGLVNPHTHLEFSELPVPLGEAGMPLPDWIGKVVSQRRENADLEGAVLSTGRRGNAIQQGVRQCLAGGATTVGDIATWDVADEFLSSDALHCFAFRELLGLTAERIVEQMERVRRYLALPLPAQPPITRGISPHAPYTAAPELVQQAVMLSKQHRLNVAMHLAESPEELKLLAEGDGPFRDLLQRFGVWDEGAFPGRKQPLDYLQMLTAAHRSLVIHGNFLGPDDWALLARHRRTMSVVYCPRTHDYFSHPPYPLARMLRAGVRVALGTDGRASNPDLDYFQELKFAAQRQSEIEPQQLLRMVTLDAAESLGCADRVGSLECGKQADLAIVQLAPSSAIARDPYIALLDDAATVSGVWIAGVPT